MWMLSGCFLLSIVVAGLDMSLSADISGLGSASVSNAVLSTGGRSLITDRASWPPFAESDNLPMRK